MSKSTQAAAVKLIFSPKTQSLSRSGPCSVSISCFKVILSGWRAMAKPPPLPLTACTMPALCSFCMILRRKGPLTPTCSRICATDTVGLLALAMKVSALAA